MDRPHPFLHSTSFDRFTEDLDRLGPFETFPLLAVAVSGGPDSLALAFLAHEWVQKRGGRLVALHVDHKLRSTSTLEAHQVKEWLEKASIPCYVLPWDHSLLTTSIQKQARAARYDILTSFCQHNHLFHLLLGHHADDQRETFYFRRSRGSTVEGLAGMSAIEETPYVRVLRPLLNWTKEELRLVLNQHPFIEDPSNMNPLYWRGRFRQSSNNRAGNTVSAGVDRQSIEKEVALLFAHYGTIFKEGYGLLQKGFQKTIPLFLQQKFLGKLLTTLGGHSYPIRTEVVTHLLEQLPSLPKGYWVTGGGCKIRSLDEAYLVVREEGRIREERPLLSTEAFLWDGRFWIDQLPENISARSLVCRALGPQGWKVLKRQEESISCPAHAAYSLPAFFTLDGEIVFFPFGDFKKMQRVVNSPRVCFAPKSRFLRSLWVGS